jgi:hypothetical protein
MNDSQTDAIASSDGIGKKPLSEIANTLFEVGGQYERLCNLIMKGRHQTPFTNVIEYFNNLYSYELFLDFSIINFEEKIKLFEKEIDAKPDDEKSDGFSDYTNHLKSDYLDYIYKTSFIFAYTIFEKSLKEFCDISKKKFELQLSHEDKEIKAGNDIDTYKKYLKTVVNVSININLDIHNYRDIRNLIIHHLGEISYSKRKTELDKFLKKSKNLRVENGIILINKSFVIDFIKLIHETLDKIERTLSDKYLTQ